MKEGNFGSHTKKGSLEELQEDLLWNILGFLDARTLRTARLVCRHFRQCGSTRLKKLHLKCSTLEHHPKANFTQFSGLTHLSVSLADENRLHLLGNPGLPPLVTHVHVQFFDCQDAQNAQKLAQLGVLSKLRSLTLHPVGEDAVSVIPALPPGLKELKIVEHISLRRMALWDGLQDASPLTRCCKLTSLAVQMAVGAGSSLASLTSLCSLSSLDLSSCPSAVRVLSMLTMLTGLAWCVKGDVDQGALFHDLSHLTGLSQLRLSRICTSGAVTGEDLGCIARLTNLTCLDLYACSLDKSVAGSSALAPLSRLASLRLSCYEVGMSLLSCLKLEGFQSLALICAMGDASVLQRATGLTHLEFGNHESGNLPWLGAALAKMSGLCSLRLHQNSEPSPPEVFQLGPIVQQLTKLTELDYSGHGRFTVDTDLRACGSLPELQSLSLMGVKEVTPACLQALQAMTGLTYLGLFDTGIWPEDITPGVTAAFDAQRLSRGWPCLKVECVCTDDDDDDL